MLILPIFLADATDGMKPEKRSMISILSQFLSSSAENCLGNPFSPSEHLLLPQSLKVGLVVCIQTDLLYNSLGDDPLCDRSSVVNVEGQKKVFLY